MANTFYKLTAKLQPTNPRAGLQAAFLANKFDVADDAQARGVFT